jgi:hypothetical protein
LANPILEIRGDSRVDLEDRGEAELADYPKERIPGIEDPLNGGKWRHRQCRCNRSVLARQDPSPCRGSMPMWHSPPTPQVCFSMFRASVGKFIPIPDGRVKPPLARCLYGREACLVQKKGPAPFGTGPPAYASSLRNRSTTGPESCPGGSRPPVPSQRTHPPARVAAKLFPCA